MGLPKGIRTVEWLRIRAKDQRGGKERKPLLFSRDAPDALVTWSETWMESLRARNYADGSVIGLFRSMNFFMKWAAERDITRAGEVTRPILETYQRWLWRYQRQGRGQGKPLSWSTQYKHLCCLKEWFRWLTRQNVIIHNPASELEMPRMEKRLPTEALKYGEVEQLLAVPDTSDPLGVRDRAILELFYATGLRRAELCELQLPDINQERGTVTVHRGKWKKDRVVPIGARAAHWVTRYAREVRPRLLIDNREQALFISGYGEAFNPDVVSRMVSTWMRQIGKKASCHLLRHTCATHMLEGGADIRYIQQLLGHENLETTALYAEVTIQQLLEVHARCHPAGKLENAASVATENPAT
jgi:integrase/recombinase XerD